MKEMETTTVSNPLTNIKNGQWLKLVELLTDNLFALNSRILAKVEILYIGGDHYPAVYFRLTTDLENPKDKNPKTEISGFLFGFDNDLDNDVYIHPLTS
jgi:hypothetical protein